MKYILSPYYKWINKHDFLKETALDPSSSSLATIMNDKRYILSFRNKKYFIVNHSIKTYLDKFSQANTLDSVTDEFAKQYIVNRKELDQELQFFFEEMIERRVLIKAQKFETIAKSILGNLEDQQKYQKGQKVGAYTIESCISSRKNSQLYLAVESANNSKVVLKVFCPPKDLKDSKRENLLKAFQQEFELMSKLESHNNVCQFIDYDKVHHFGIIEYIDGLSLRKYLKSLRPLKTKLSLVKQISASLAHLHKQQIVHGDIHLSNFLIDKAGLVKLIDFGMSNHLEPRQNEVIQKGGVHKFIAPEKIRENAFSFIQSSADSCSEVYQMGVVFYYILYEQYPFDGFTWLQLARSIREDTPKFYTFTPKLKEAIPPEFIKLLQKCLEKNPAHRINSALEVVIRMG